MSETQHYAIIQLLGKQHRVTTGEKLVVDRLTDHAEGETFEVKEVLLVANGDDVQIGQPLVEKASVTLKVLTHGRGDKIRVAVYKSKSKYRKANGHRQHQSTIEVVKIA